MSYAHFSNECGEHWPDLFAVQYGVFELADSLNTHNGLDRGEMSMQMLKLSEEVGEVAQAWIGFTGQNPRKGITHTQEQVFAELADVAITALVAIARMGGSPIAEVATKVATMRERYAALEAGR